MATDSAALMPPLRSSESRHQAVRFDEAGSIVWSEGTDLNPTSIAQHFNR
jgi:hypothetical protein